MCLSLQLIKTPLPSFGFSQKQTLQFESKQFIWDVIPRNTVGEGEEAREGKAANKQFIMQKSPWGSQSSGCPDQASEPPEPKSKEAGHLTPCSHLPLLENCFCLKKLPQAEGSTTDSLCM